jgi:hypothetical protein
MAISIPLESMSVEEKIQIMEIIWDDLCHKTDGMGSQKKGQAKRIVGYYRRGSPESGLSPKILKFPPPVC